MVAAGSVVLSAAGASLGGAAANKSSRLMRGNYGESVGTETGNKKPRRNAVGSWSVELVMNKWGRLRQRSTSNQGLSVAAD